MGRRRKFRIDEVVRRDFDHKRSQYAVVIAYRVKGAQSEYRIVRLDYQTGPAWGRPIWIAAELLFHLPGRTWLKVAFRPNIRRVVVANERIGSSTERGCRCQCCPHTAMPRNVVAQEARDNAIA